MRYYRQHLRQEAVLDSVTLRLYSMLKLKSNHQVYGNRHILCSGVTFLPQDLVCATMAFVGQQRSAQQAVSMPQKMWKLNDRS